ncbi:unnamed protein product [Paramecium sonneborni]|uniref:DH domain-containing protein n=1 Tax=Paramecium sonneborni TaxID=65129 RepID=A0A8S1PRD1_9CILI|nr:unnamed protein product [Paramecium sonneborni]
MNLNNNQLLGQPKAQFKMAQSSYQQPQQQQQQQGLQVPGQSKAIEESHCIRVMSKEVKAAARMQEWFKGKKQQKIYQKMKKKHRYRKNVIAEIINTERTYVNDLSIICEKVKTSSLPILTPNDIETIFMNCDQILGWNREFLQEMEKGYCKYNVDKKQMPKPYQPVFDGNAKQLKIPDAFAFKCYYEYCSKFTKSNKHFEHLKATDQKFKEFLTQLNKNGTLRGMDLGSFLVKPIQRLPKYILLFKDLEKNTDEDYPDLPNIKEIHKYFKEVNEENNKFMDIFMGRLQLQQLSESLKINQDDLLNEPNRIYKFEEKLTIIQPNAKSDEDCQVTVHALSDMLVVVHDEKVQKKLKLDSLSFVKNQSDNNKYFSNLFQIVGVGDTIQCIAETPAAKKKYIDQFEKLIQENRELEYAREKEICKQQIKMRYPVQVVVVGTEERNFQSFTKHTQYITEISINKVFQNIFIRYSEIEVMSIKYKQRYPRIELPQLPDKNWLMSHKTKSIEARKIAIENFLQALLQAKEIQQDSDILNELKLPKNFFDLPDLYQSILKSNLTQKQQNFKRTTLEGKEELREKGINVEKLKTSAGEILKAVYIEQETRKKSVVQICPNKVISYDNSKDPSLHKIIITFPDGTETALGVTEQTRVREILEYVAKYNHLIYYKDFRLYLIDQLKKQRVLDDDEVLYKVIEDERQNNHGILNKLEQMLAKSNAEVLIKMKKYIYLPAKLEESDYKEDPIRLINLAFSILDDVHDQKLQLGFKEYCLFAALYFHMKHSRLDDKLFGEVRRVVPQEMFQSSTDKEWKDLVTQCFKALDNELSQISKKNENDKIQKKPNSQFKHTDKKYLAAGVTLNAARTFVQSSMAIFQVQVYEGTQKFFKNAGLEVHPTIYLGLSIHKIHFLNPQRKEQFREIDYGRVNGVKSYPSQIIFDLQIFKEPIRFDTYQSYEIKSLVEQYQAIQRFDDEYELGHQFNIKH